MERKIFVSMSEIQEACADIAIPLSPNKNIYGVPRGGFVPASMIAGFTNGYLVDDPKDAYYIIDDLIDSGRTHNLYREKFPNAQFIAVYDKKTDFDDRWVVFPWEVTKDGNDESIEDAFVRLIQYIGEDPDRQGLEDTPKRMAKAWRDWTVGYSMNPKDFLTVFEDGSEQYDEIVLLKDIPYYSKCEHHLETFYGTASIGYIPRPGSIIGISKLGRILDMFARRLQVQERMTNQIADCIVDLIDPLAVGVVVKGKHFCTMSRGLNKTGQVMVTSSLRGHFRTKPEARAEFMALVNNGGQ